MTTELTSAAASAIRVVMFILHSTKLRQAAARVANSLLHHVIAEASPDSFQPSSQHYWKNLRAPNQKPARTAHRSGHRRARTTAPPDVRFSARPSGSRDDRFS